MHHKSNQRRFNLLPEEYRVLNNPPYPSCMLSSFIAVLLTDHDSSFWWLLILYGVTCMVIVEEFGLVAFFVHSVYVAVIVSWSSLRNFGWSCNSCAASANMDSFPDVVLLRISSSSPPKTLPDYRRPASSLRTFASISCSIDNTVRYYLCLECSVKTSLFADRPTNSR